MNNKGQAILSEYVMIFFVVIAAVVAMTTFIQRGLEARVHDARNFMIDSASTALVNVCAGNTDCTAAVGNKVPYEYEPYYAQMISDVGHKEQENAGETPSSVNWSIGAVYTKSLNEETQTNSFSVQSPPCASANPVPSWCGKSSVPNKRG